jgi:hypothetical protein
MDYRWIKALKVSSWTIFILALLLAVSLTVYGVISTGNILIGGVYFLVIGGPALLLHCFMMIFSMIAVKILGITPEDVPIEYEFEEVEFPKSDSESESPEQKIPLE